MLSIFKSIKWGLFATGVFFTTVVNALGQMPTPVINAATINTAITFDQLSRTYKYDYVVSNVSGNTGDIWHVAIDVSQVGDNGMRNQTLGLTIPFGTWLDFSSMLSQMDSLNNSKSVPASFFPKNIVPFGQTVPQGWFGALGLDSYAHFFSGDNAPNIVPGLSMSGFQLVSYGVPTIRKSQIYPLWMHLVQDHDSVSDADMIEAANIEQGIIYNTESIGPSGISYGSFAHWDQLRDDLARAIQLKWISSNTLAKDLTDQLAIARQTFDSRDLYTTKLQLTTLLNTINNSSPSQRTSEGYGLVALNVQSLIDNTADNQIEPKVTLTPKGSILSIGKQQSLSVNVIDLANGKRPIPNIPVQFSVQSGPHSGFLGEMATDSLGNAAITYTGIQVGTDKVNAAAPFYGGEVMYEDAGLITWSGGADLVTPLFSPPELESAGGRRFYITEETLNIGNVTSGPSVTRYFISQYPNIDIATAQILGERSVPSLKPGQSSRINRRVFTLPQNLIPGKYYLAACADANNTVVELDEGNNCSFNKIEGYQSVIVPIKNDSKKPSEIDDDDDERCYEERCEGGKCEKLNTRKSSIWERLKRFTNPFDKIDKKKSEKDN